MAHRFIGNGLQCQACGGSPDESRHRTMSPSERPQPHVRLSHESDDNLRFLRTLEQRVQAMHQAMRGGESGMAELLELNKRIIEILESEASDMEALEHEFRKRQLHG